MKLTLTRQRWDMVAPFVTAGETVNHIDVLHVKLEHEGREGRAETMGVDYFGETVESLQRRQHFDGFALCRSHAPCA